MKLFILLVTLTFSAITFASGTIESSKEPGVQYFDLIIDIHRTYSQSAGLDAKVIEILGGDGVNPTRMFLVINTGYQDSQVFELGEMMYEVTRITFLTKEVIVINYTQDSFDEDGNTTLIKKSLKIKVLRNADNTLANKIEILD
ncbi:MAG: hypothetical protein K2Q18_12960 [Bdellovibrionales bacterium]|nr:hypothetical protein [Bdellovibrionales bacterium]